MVTPRLVPAQWQLPSVLKIRLGRSVGRQRLMIHEDQLLIVAHEVPEAEAIRRGVLFWHDDEKNWHASNSDPGKIAVDNLLNKYEKKLEEFDALESKAKLAEDYLQVIEGLAPVARAATNLRDVLQEARKTAPAAIEIIDWRDRADDLARTAELTYQYAKDSMNVAVIKRADEQAAASKRMEVSSYRLNMMAALFFPLATLGSIFGTTLTDNWSWADSAGPFILFLLVGLAAGMVLATFVNSNRK